MKRIFLFIIIFLIMFTAIVRANAESEKKDDNPVKKLEGKMSFAEINKKATELYKEKKYDEVIAIYEKALPNFPDRVYEITFLVGQLYMALGQYEKSLDTFAYGLEKKAIYPIWPGSKYWAPLEKFERFKKIMEENDRLKKERTAKTKVQVKVIRPTAYSQGKEYPLFVVLHGWNESLENIEKPWQAERLTKDFVVLLIQSSQVVSSTKFGWDDPNHANEDIERSIIETIGKYSINKDKIIIGGFSQGGLTAMQLVASHTHDKTKFKIIGFIALQPGGNIPPSFNVENLARAREQGCRGTIIIREQDKEVQVKKDILQLIQAAGFPCRCIISGTNHWYPADFSQQLDAAIEDIMK